MKKILVCDGGGIRGKATTAFLCLIEEELEKHGTSLKECVDFFAGTSTGAIIACAIATTDMSMKEIDSLYNPRIAGVIFTENEGLLEWDGVNAPKYEGKEKAAVLQSEFLNARVGDVPNGKHVLVSAYSVEKRQSIMIKSTKKEHRDVFSWKAADVSSAAPTYFPTVEAHICGENHWLIDGGVIANNPSMCALAEAINLWGLYKDRELNLKLLSVGTGYQTRKINGPQSTKWGALGWVTKGDLIGILQDERVIDYQVRTILGDGHYLRVNSEMTSQVGLEYPPDDAMDDVSAGNIQKLSDMGKFWFEQHGRETINFLLS